jgi:hypothetical protein
MARNFAQGIYKPKNPQKYVGIGSIKYRSSWELTVCQFFDDNPNILEWASEPLRIPYFNPMKNKKTTYVPDFLVVYRDKNGDKRIELVEVKPKSQSLLVEGMKPKDKAVVLVNHAKWEQAIKWCDKRGITFRVMTEQQIYKR